MYNKLYEYEYNLFGQVRLSSKYQTSSVSLNMFQLRLIDWLISGCLCDDDISIWTSPWFGIQNSFSKMVSCFSVFQLVTWYSVEMITTTTLNCSYINLQAQL